MARILATTLIVMVIFGSNLMRSAPAAFAAPVITVPSPLTVGQNTTATGGGFGANATGFICLVTQSPGVCQPNQLFPLSSDAAGNLSYPFIVPNFLGQQTIDVTLGGLNASFLYTINANGTPPPVNGNGSILNGNGQILNGNGHMLNGNGHFKPKPTFLYPGQLAPSDYLSFPGAGGMQLIVPSDKNFSRYGPGTYFFPQGYVGQSVVPRPQQWFGVGPGISSANNGGYNQNPWGNPIGASCYGAGVAQNIDAAALELYQAYRNYGNTVCPANQTIVPFNQTGLTNFGF